MKIVLVSWNTVVKLMFERYQYKIPKRKRDVRNKNRTTNIKTLNGVYLFLLYSDRMYLHVSKLKDKIKRTGKTWSGCDSKCSPSLLFIGLSYDKNNETRTR